VTTVGSYSATATLSPSAGWVMQVGTFRGATAGPQAGVQGSSGLVADEQFSPRDGSRRLLTASTGHSGEAGEGISGLRGAHQETAG
jgi:hypothetical protein